MTDEEPSQKSNQKYTNLNFLRQMTKENSKMITEMILVYLEETPKYIEWMKEGINKRDWELVAKAAHSFLPSFPTMGLNQEFTDMVKKINEYAQQQERHEEIKDLIIEIENVCLQANEELNQELHLMNYPTPELRDI